MNARVKKLWVEALRSGEYVQCQGKLAKNGEKFDKFCCLGVLANLYCEEKGLDFDSLCAPYEGYFLPPPVLRWAELKSKDPDAGESTLSEHNDGCEVDAKPFAQIADLIEKHL